MTCTVRIWASTAAAPSGTGAYWWDDRTLHYRAENYWKPGTRITVSANIYGVDLGDGVYGETDRTMTVTIGKSKIARVDDATKQMEIFVDDKKVRTVPVSLGRNKSITVADTDISFVTPSGTYVAQEKYPVKKMNSASYGLPVESDLGYDKEIPLAVRFSNEGIFVHSAPWSVEDQGVRNVSHGCINVNPKAAKWFFDNFGYGDILTVRARPRNWPRPTATATGTFRGASGRPAALSPDRSGSASGLIGRSYVFVQPRQPPLRNRPAVPNDVQQGLGIQHIRFEEPSHRQVPAPDEPDAGMVLGPSPRRAGHRIAHQKRESGSQQGLDRPEQIGGDCVVGNSDSPPIDLIRRQVETAATQEQPVDRYLQEQPTGRIVAARTQPRLLLVGPPVGGESQVTVGPVDLHSSELVAQRRCQVPQRIGHIGLEDSLVGQPVLAAVVCLQPLEERHHAAPEPVERLRLRHVGRLR